VRNRAQRRCAVLILVGGAIALASCDVQVDLYGGSGGINMPPPAGSPPPPPPPSVPGKAAWTAWMRAEHQDTLNATDTEGNTYYLQIRSTPGAGTPAFAGPADASRSVVSLTITKNGTPYLALMYPDYDILRPSRETLPEQKSDATSFSALRANSLEPLPATLTAGDSGLLYEMISFHDSSMQTVDASRTVTYFVSSNSATALNLCLVHEVADPRISPQRKIDGFVPSARTICYRVDEAGNAALAKIFLFEQNSGRTLAFE